MLSKSMILIAGFCIFSYSCYSQEAERSKTYEIRNSVAVYPCYITGKRVYRDDRFSTPPIGAKFFLVRPLRLNSDTFIIRYLKWTDEADIELRKYYNDPLIFTEEAAVSEVDINKPWSNSDTASAKGERSRWGSSWPGRDTRSSRNDTSGMAVASTSYGSKVEKYFLMQRYDLDSNCVKVYNAGIRSAIFTIGLVTMPLKLRLGTNFDFQGNLSLGSTAGVKMRLSRYNSNYLNLLIGTSISTVTLDSFSTRGKVTGQPITNLAVFSPSLGLVFEFGKAQAGLFYGWDFLNKSTQTKYGWIYNKKPWLSIGFGFSIFNIDSKSNNAQTENQ